MTSVLAIRVARRYLARDFPNEKALEKYLHEHPAADKHKHHVTEHEDKGHGDHEHGESEHGKSEHGEHDEHHGGMFSRLKGALKSVAGKFKDAPKDVQKFIGDKEHRKAALKKGLEGLKGAAPKYVQAFVKTAKEEVKEFKTAGQGIGALLKGNKPTKAQKHAMKEVATHMAITIAASALTTATPALAALAAGKGLATNLALKSATRVMGDLHALQEIGHIGHHAAHPLSHVLHHILHNLHHLKLADGDEKGGKAASPEEVFGVLVMKHVAEQVSKLDDDDYLAELLEDAKDDKDGDDEGEDAVGGDDQQKQASLRVASLYIARALSSAG